MINSIKGTESFQEKALALRTYRQQILAANIANADTPNYKARDIDFASVLRQTQAGGSLGLSKTSAGHLGMSGGVVAGARTMYRNTVQPSIDGNTVDSNIEQAKFGENAMQTMATIQFISGEAKEMLLALRGS